MPIYSRGGQGLETSHHNKADLIRYPGTPKWTKYPGSSPSRGLHNLLPKQSRIWKKSSSTSQKILPLVRAKTCSAVAEGMGLTRITSPLSLSMNVLLSHQDLLKDFYLNSTHSVPSDLSFFVLNCQLAHNAGRGWVLQHPGHFFLNINCLVVQGTQLGTSFIKPHTSWLSSMFKEENVFLFYIALSQGLFLYVPPLFSINLM